MVTGLLRRARGAAAIGALIALTGLAPAVGTSTATATTPVSSSAGDTQPGTTRAPYDAPLDVTIDEMTPGVLPRTGPVVVRGTITNVDLESWRGISVYPTVDAGPGCVTCTGEPITTRAELVKAAASDPNLPVGDRVLEVRTPVPSLAPGESADYTLRIPQSVLREKFSEAAPGVYWFGVHALGGNDTTPDDFVADGRARTFLPVVPPRLQDSAVNTAVVVPLRASVARDGDGALLDTGVWETSLEAGGALGGPLAFGSASAGRPVSWLVDPAVPDAVRQLARGNPDRSLAPARAAAKDPEDEESTDADDGAGAPQVPDSTMSAARAWLRSAQQNLADGGVLRLPYGDPDLDTASVYLSNLYATARNQPAPVLDQWDVTTTPVVAPPDGYLEPSSIDQINDGATLLLDQKALPYGIYKGQPPVDGVIGDRPVVITAQTAAAGGPGPSEALAPIALRQRLLGEAAVRLLAAPQDPAPLVVVLPPTITAASADEFWRGLDVEWVNLVNARDLAANPKTASSSQQIDPTKLTAPKQAEVTDTEAEVEAGRLVTAARTLQSVLGGDYAVGSDLVGEALTAASYASSGDVTAPDRIRETQDWVADQLAAITVDAPTEVSLSGSSGEFNVSVRNELDQPVTVYLKVVTDDGAEVSVANPIMLGANSRSSVPVQADISRSGVHNLTLRLTDKKGRPLGADDTLPLRTGQSSVVIWSIIGVGAALLFVAIAIRLFRRVRAHRKGGAENPAENPAESSAVDTA